jgi:hypothetical protein
MMLQQRSSFLASLARAAAAERHQRWADLGQTAEARNWRPIILAVLSFAACGTVPPQSQPAERPVRTEPSSRPDRGGLSMGNASVQSRAVSADAGSTSTGVHEVVMRVTVGEDGRAGARR